MTIQTMISTKAANNFGALIEFALKGGATIIERYSRPAAVIAGYDEWQRLKKAEIRELNRRSREMDEGNYVTGEEVDGVLGA
ncbi:MAG: type II toxin-antitoxin system Phd/YefM family antitoxin [Chloroflexota bacterium]